MRLPDEISLPVGSILVINRGYLDFARLFALLRQKIVLVYKADLWISVQKPSNVCVVFSAAG
jgi:hypothetical protein